jgi:hypothetical protein
VRLLGEGGVTSGGVSSTKGLEKKTQEKSEKSERARACARARVSITAKKLAKCSVQWRVGKRARERAAAAFPGLEKKMVAFEHEKSGIRRR